MRKLETTASTHNAHNIALTATSLPCRRKQQQMALLPYFGNDPFFGQMEKALDRAFDRAMTGGRGDMMLLPSLVGPTTAGGHPMVRH